MKNNKSRLKKLPKNTKFAKFDSENEDVVLLEFLIANLIHNGTSFNELMKPTDLIENKKDREEMKTKITNIILDFIDINPQYINILKQNDDVSEFLNFFDSDFII